MCVTVVAIDLTYVDLERLNCTWFCFFVLEFFHFVLEMSWKCGHPDQFSGFNSGNQETNSTFFLMQFSIAD